MDMPDTIGGQVLALALESDQPGVGADVRRLVVTAGGPWNAAAPRTVGARKESSLTKRQLLLVSRIACSGCSLLAFVSAAYTGAPKEAAAASGLEPGCVKTAMKLLARSVWSVVPNAPQHKRDLRPELIRGSAVAVSNSSLLASCGALGGSERIGLVRHGKFRIARLSATDPGRDICVLDVADVPLNVAREYRNPTDLAVGEPVYAVTNRTKADFSLIEGRVIGAFGVVPSLETSLVLPAGMLSAVVFDRYGSLVGLGAPAPGSQTLVTPITATLAPTLVVRDHEVQGTPSCKRDHEPSEGAQAGESEKLAVAAAAQPEATLQVTLSARQGSRPVLKTKEPLEVHLWAGADAYAYCFYADSDGRVSRVLPNRFQPDALVPAGRKVTIPRTGAGFTIVPEKPDTSEEIRCFVAERDPGPALPAALISLDLAPLPADSLLDVAGAFRRAGSAVVEVGLPIQVVGEDHITAALERRSRP
jgi:hypothetical protein